MPDHGRQTIAGALLLLAGGAIGAGLGVLFAPQSGEKTRKKVARYGRRIQGDAEEVARRGAESVSRFVDEMNEKTSALVNKGEDVGGELRRNFLQALESGQKSLHKQRSRLSKIWD